MEQLAQIAFAADTYRDFRIRGYSHAEAAKMTIEKGYQSSEGNLIRGVTAMMGLGAIDASNSYDDAVIKTCHRVGEPDMEFSELWH